MSQDDGGLRSLFRQRLPDAFWTSIESGGTVQGIPDSHYLFVDGESGWVEFKLARGKSKPRVKLSMLQAVWISRYSRMGGRAFVVARIPPSSACIGLVIVSGPGACLLVGASLWDVEDRYRSYIGGPRQSDWDWAAIRRVLTS